MLAGAPSGAKRFCVICSKSIAPTGRSYKGAGSAGQGCALGGEQLADAFLAERE